MSSGTPSRLSDLLLRPSEMADRLLSIDLGATPLGPLSSWPQSLRTAVGVCLNSRFPMFVWWGPQLINIYNDAYIPILGKRHPRAFARPARETWAEIWPTVGPQAEAVMTRGEATWNERVLLVMERHGYTEDTWFTWSYSPIPDDSGGIGGLFCACTEETGRVIAERERENAEHALRRSEERLSTVFDQTTAGFAQTDLTGRFVLVNQQYCSMVGRTAEELYRLRMQDITHPDDLSANLPHFQRLVREGTPFVIEKRYTRLDGSLLWVRNNVAPLKDQQGRVAYVLAASVDITDYKRSQQALRESEERFRALVSATSDVVYRMGSDWSEMRRLEGREFIPDTLEPSRTWVDTYIHPDDQRMVLSAVRRAIETKSVFELEHRVNRIDGSVGWTYSRAVPIFDSSGAILEWFGAASDITDRKRAQERLDFVVNSGQIGLWYCDLPFDTLVWNEKVKQHFGLPPDAEVTIDTFYDRLHPDDREPTRRAIARSIAERSDYDIEYRTVGLDGRVRWVRAIGKAAYTDNGTPIHFDGITVEVTARREAEMALAESEQRFRTYANAAPSMLWVTDPEGRATFLSSGWYEYTGQTEGQAMGKGGFGWLDAVDPQDRGESARIFLEANAKRHPFSILYRLRRHDGEYRWAIDAARPRFDGEGGFLGFVGSVIDVHERELARQSLREHAESLERANQELERFVAIASHDLKEPLRGISTLSSFIAEDAPALDELSRARLARIKGLCSRLTEMVNGLLEYARSGGERLSQPCDLERIARDAIDKMAEQLRHANAEVTVLGPLPVVEGDPVLLERMFANLIANGVRYNESAEKRVEIGCEGARVYVRDNGVGLDPVYHDRVFELFKRVGPLKDGATGLGLALVRNIVRSHGGRVWIESEPGNGATFYIELPGARCPDLSPVG
jgi:PAS domain S-box-containing protein